MKIKISIAVAMATILLSCKKEAKDENSKDVTKNVTEIKTISAMKKVMMGEDLSAHINWDTIPKQNLYAVCPLERIEGEVTIIDGKMFSSKVVENNVIEIKNDWNIQSPFAVYAYVTDWEELETEANFSNDDELQAFIEELAIKRGRDISKPFVFRIIGIFDTVDYHIISKPKDEIEHNHELHDKAKKHFSLQNVTGELLGFFSKNHEGVFTHRGHYIHTHFIDEAQKNMGHLEKAKTNKKVKVLISK